MQAQTEPTAPERIDATPGQFGGLLGGAEQQAGATVEGAGEKAAQTGLQLANFYNEAQAQSGQDVWADATNKILHDPQDGFFLKKGLDAGQSLQATQAALAASRQQVMAGLSNDRQRLLFDNLTRYSYDRQLFNMSEHANEQTLQYANGQWNASVANRLQQAGTHWNDDALFANDLQQAQNAATALGKYSGWSQEQIDAKNNDVTSRAWQSRIVQASAVDPARAQALFDANRDKLEPSVAAELALHLKAGNDRGVASSAAMQAFQGSGAPLGAAIKSVARPGVNTDTLERTARLENASGDPNAVSSTGARGYLQWTGSTAKQYGVTPGDAASEADGGARFQIDNRLALANALGRAPTEAEVYLAHQQGAEGAAKLILHPDLPAAVALGNANAIAVNGGTPGMTAAAFVQKWTDKFNAAGPPPGASNDAAPDHTTDRAAGLARLMARTDLTDQQKELALTQFERLYTLQKAINQDASEQAFNEYIPQALKNPGTFPLDAMLSDNRMTGIQKSQAYNIYKRALNGDIDKPTEISQQERTRLLDGIRDGSIKDPNVLVDSVAHNGLSASDYNFVRQRFDEAQTDNGRSLNKQTTELFKEVEHDMKVVPMGDFGASMANPHAGMDFYKWKRFAYDQIAAKQRAGQPVDPLFDPNAKEFLGSDALMKQYRTPINMGTALQDKPVVAPPAPLKPPESAAEIGAAYQSGYYGDPNDPASRTRAAAELQRRGMIAAPPQAAAPPTVQVPH